MLQGFHWCGRGRCGRVGDSDYDYASCWRDLRGVVMLVTVTATGVVMLMTVTGAGGIGQVYPC